MELSRRAVITGAAALGAAALGACSGSTQPTSSTSASGAGSGTPGADPTSTAAPSSSASSAGLGVPIGDGSTTEQRPQPGLPPIHKLKPGETPPQFVVISWDGAGNLASNQLGRFRQVAQRTNAQMTLFLSGIYFLPEDKATLYQPPGRKAGSSDIGFLTRQSCHRTIEGIGQAWLEGHEIGTHFNGHFCGPRGVSRWSVADWKAEIAEAKKFVTTWRTTTRFTDLPPMPFDYEKELVGGRTPCLEGYHNLQIAATQLGWRYDSSHQRQHVWPTRLPGGLWDLSMTMAPLPGRSFPTIPMDYNYMVNQIGPNPSGGNPADRPRFQAQHRDSLVQGVQRSLRSNRAPFILGNHFEQWNGGIHMNAVEQAMDAYAAMPGVQMVTFRWLCDWMEAQDPEVLRRLQALNVGEAPPGGWKTYLDPAAPSASATSSATSPAMPSATRTTTRA
ncbi:hypothetical protein [Arsenicicoccus sp. oral taxon 190]|uniref:hypothetical protein n=1 Tax=Arsenicicoccus sp. oral taxon 190 TaxID=1658671 RepID=UPI000679FAF9|nr:hypothetical protein [Arsenicicoccus sp. oral taxon 190]AKT52260.1 hypothetical protein ADJ73_15040 [Arsenicicoccus sp. oral taxon 190]